MINESREINDIKSIFKTALETVDPYKIILASVKLKKNILTINKKKWSLKKYNEIIILGAGKATAKMALAIENILGDKITKGLISVKKGHTEKLEIIKIIEASHPVPDEKSYEAAKKIFDIVSNSTEKSLIINLISGGGSALLSYPMELSNNKTLSLQEKQDTTKELLKCGADIQEINCIRKHLSKIKGGRLAEVMWPSDSINLILSDVVGDNLDTIASGLTSPDNSTYREALEIIEKYNISNKIPEKVNKILEMGINKELKETPKPEDHIFEKVENIIIGSNLLAVKAAYKKALKLKYNCIILSSQITGEAKELAKFLLGIAKEIKKNDSPLKKPACILCGGETTVTIQGKGKGGRNQEMSLAFLNEFKKDPENCKNLHFLSGATDGNDGPTDAAGAFVNMDIFELSKKMNLSSQEYLKNNDSYNFFDKLDALCKTGPTNTNVCDIQIMIIK